MSLEKKVDSCAAGRGWKTDFGPPMQLNEAADKGRTADVKSLIAKRASINWQNDNVSAAFRADSHPFVASP